MPAAIADQIQTQLLANDGSPSRSYLKRHKTLPRPQDDAKSLETAWRKPTRKDVNLSINTSPSAKSEPQPPSPRMLKHQPRRIGTWPDPPPTPPTHSRTSSGPQPAIPSSPTIPVGLVHSNDSSTGNRTPTTPPGQRSPPTPDVTPPQAAVRSRNLHYLAVDRGAGVPNPTPAGSLTESFRTALEDPMSSGEEESSMTARPLIPSTSTSQTTIRLAPRDRRNLEWQPEDGNHNHYPEPSAQTGHEFQEFDGNWATPKEAGTNSREADITTPRKRNMDPGRRYSKDRGAAHAIHHNLTQPTKSSSARVPRKLLVEPERQPQRRATTTTTTDERDIQFRGSSASVQSRQSTRRSSGNSAKSHFSTVVEAFLVDERPKRQQTLRHIRKQHGLRESVGHSSPTSREPRGARDRGRQASRDSAVTAASAPVASFEHAGPRFGEMPAVIVQEQLVREPSLRSVPSRRTGKTISLESIPFDDSVFPEDGEDMEDLSSVNHSIRRPRRRLSQSDPSDIRTIDYPPAVPRRSSSLSAPTSHNPSRSNSLTGDGAQARNSTQPRSKYPPLANASMQRRETAEPAGLLPYPAPASVMDPGAGIIPIKISPSVREAAPVKHVPAQSPMSSPTDRDFGSPRRFSFDHNNDETLSYRKYSSRNTPFSAASFDTSWTAPEISEAQAVQMYPHQNSSVLMVNNSNKPSEASNSLHRGSTSQEGITYPAITETPPRTQHMSDIDSPLRNPRAPPEPPSLPPAFKFIPATPSGHTPVPEKIAQMGNFYLVTGDKPPRKPSLLQRAFSRRRNSIDYPPSTSRPAGFLTRTFSRSQSRSRSREPSEDERRPATEPRSTYPNEDEWPPEGNRLHPFWTPQRLDSESTGRYVEEVFHYPPIDNRPRPPGRTLSAKMKHTFSIFPTRYEERYASEPGTEPQFLKMKRTSDGQLRVVRNSFSSVVGTAQEGGTAGSGAKAAEPDRKRVFWHGHSSQAHPPTTGRRRRSSIEHAVQGLQNLPRRLSESRREKRTQELRAKISAPRAVRDGVEDVVRPGYLQPDRNEPDRI